MFYILILLLISISIKCENWCQRVKPNGTYKGLGIYHQFQALETDSQFIMFNRAGAQWPFDVTYDGSDKYDINWRFNEFKHYKDDGVLYRFGMYEKHFNFPAHITTFLDCTVRNKVINLYFICIFIYKTVVNLRTIGSRLYARVHTLWKVRKACIIPIH